ncbi:MAG: OmpA family protein [Hyphomicrobium sp.]
MLRMRIPITLIVSGLALPALGKTTSISSAELSASPFVNIECQSLLSRQLNTEIECSIARVNAQHADAFARARNAEINASIARVSAQRSQAFEEARNTEIDASVARVAEHRARNAEIDASIAGVKAQRAKAFEDARNAEINASIALVAAQRAKAFQEARNAEINASIARVAFHRVRNAEINASIARVQAQRLKAFEQARNAEINASIARVAFHRARNAEINASIARVAVQRLKAFEQARNAEINASIARVKARRALLETGTIRMSDPRKAQSDDQANYDTRRTQACAAVALLLNQVRFASFSTKIGEGSKPTLDELATLAKRCPGAHIEIHGHTDSSGSQKANLRISKRRAKAVAIYLIAAGIDARRLKTIAHGSADPIASNTTAENRSLNRRIEFTIKDPSAEATAAIVLHGLGELLDSNDMLWSARIRP